VKAATIESAKVAASNGGLVPGQGMIQPGGPMPGNVIQRAPSPGGLGSAGTSISESSMLNAHVPGNLREKRGGDTWFFFFVLERLWHIGDF
jgi:hypothetical protein